MQSFDPDFGSTWSTADSGSIKKECGSTSSGYSLIFVVENRTYFTLSFG